MWCTFILSATVTNSGSLTDILYFFLGKFAMNGKGVKFFSQGAGPELEGSQYAIPSWSENNHLLNVALSCVLCAVLYFSPVLWL